MTAPPAISRASSLWLTAAAALGVGHGLFSLYWAMGGQWLLATVGDVATQFDGRMRLLGLVGIFKISAGLGPLLLQRWGWPLRRLSRTICWLGAAALLLWGGLSMIVAHLVLAGAVRPDNGFDPASMQGHAWLWDPWFVLWGATLVLGLIRSRPGRADASRR